MKKNCSLLMVIILGLLSACSSTGGQELGAQSDLSAPTASSASTPILVWATGTVPEKPLVSPTRSPTKTVPAILELTDTLEPTSTPLPYDSETRKLKPGSSILLTYVHMFDGGKGWGLETSGHIVHTGDGGRTWTDVTPDRTGCFDEGGFFAANDDSAWATIDRPDLTNQMASEECPDLFGIPGIMWKTMDGGKTWQSIKVYEYMGSFIPVSLYFLNDDWGYLASYSRMGDHMWGSDLFFTQDGGETWTSSESVGKRFDGGFSVIGGVRFITDSLGFLGSHGMLNLGIFDENESRTARAYLTGQRVPYLQKTTDGGISWEGFPLPPLAVFPSYLLLEEYQDHPMECETMGMTGVGKSGVGVSIGCYSDMPWDVRFAIFYSSMDEGKTWSQWLSNGSEFFLDEQTGWRISGSINGSDNRWIQRTRDYGEAWENFKRVSWKSARFTFIDPQTGWVVAGNGTTTALLFTTDGGRSWEDLLPRVTVGTGEPAQ